MFKLIIIIYIYYVCVFELKIHTPEIRLYFSPEHIMGRHGAASEDYQVIEINMAYSFSSIRETVRHELRHCWQVETFGINQIIFWSKFPTYYWRPTEADAEMYARKYIQGAKREDSPIYKTSKYCYKEYSDIEMIVIKELLACGWDGIVGSHR